MPQARVLTIAWAVPSETAEAIPRRPTQRGAAPARTIPAANRSRATGWTNNPQVPAIDSTMGNTGAPASPSMLNAMINKGRDTSGINPMSAEERSSTRPAPPRARHQSQKRKTAYAVDPSRPTVMRRGELAAE